MRATTAGAVHLVEVLAGLGAALFVFLQDALLSCGQWQALALILVGLAIPQPHRIYKAIQEEIERRIRAKGGDGGT